MNKHISLNYNAGLLFNQNYKDGIFSYSFCTTWNAHHLVSLFAEGFGYSEINGKWNEYGFDGGFVIDIKEKYQIDISYIVNLYEGMDYNWINIGFSALINQGNRYN